MKTLTIFMNSVFTVLCIVLSSFHCLDAAPITYKDYQPSSTGEICHAAIINQHSESQHAVKRIFDNRLNASEVRKEMYYFKIPEDFKGKVPLQANLNYLPYPSSLSTRFGLPEPRLFEVSSAIKELILINEERSTYFLARSVNGHSPYQNRR